MALSLKYFVGISFIGLVTINLCTASKTVKAKFTEKKQPLTSHTTLQSVSEIQCVKRCNKDRQTGECTLAGYNKAMRSCYLSVDGPHDVLDTTDEMSGIFFFEPDQTSIFHFKF